MDEVAAFDEFFRETMQKELSELAAAYPEKKSLQIDFKKLEKFNHELADALLENPDQFLRSAETAVEQLNFATFEGKKLKTHCRFFNLPENRNVLVQYLGAEHLDKLISVEGVISLVAEIKPLIKTAVWECFHCGAIVKTHPEKNILSKPDLCRCGRRDFKHLEKEDEITNMQNAKMQDLVENMKGSAPASNISLWLEDDLVNILAPGEKFKISGILRRRPITKGGPSSVYDKMLEIVYLERSEKEFESLVISKEEKTEFQELATKANFFDIIVDSVAPSIFGYRELKLAIALQLFGGNSNKVLPDGKKIRGDAHILIIGDPGCLIADERIVLGNGAIVKLGNMGNEHLQEINISVLTGEGGAKRDTATVFHSYSKQPTMEIITESGKSIKGTLNHPLLSIVSRNGTISREWKRLDEFKIGDRVATVTGISCSITGFLPTNFKTTERRLGPKFKGKLPKTLTPEFAGLLGYLLGDGWVQKYRTGFVVAEGEKDILPLLLKKCENLFNITPRVIRRKQADRKVFLHYATIGSMDVSQNLRFLRNKRVPDLVLQSGNEVASEFLKWLYEADGCVFDKGRGKRSVSLKAKNIEMLRDVQILLLRFGIHSRILENNLMIRRGNDILRFAEKIGFVSEKKRTKMKEAAKNAKQYARVGGQRSERIVKIIRHAPEDVFDIEVPKSHRFIANGIISHNTAKSAMLQYVKNLAPKCIYVGGKGASGVGLTASAERDEFSEGWVLKAGAMVLASGGQVNIDEFDKMDDNDRSALHEAMEQQQISIAKAGIVTTFKAKTAVLAAANPKLGRFDPNQPPALQFDIPPTLQSRFDLIFPIKDVLDEVHDRKLADHVLLGHRIAAGSDKESEKSILPAIPVDKFRKYIAYSRQNFYPILGAEATEKIRDYYLRLRKLGEKQNNYPVTARQIEGLVRLSEASARARLSNTVDVQDADRAITLTQYVLETVFMDKETGKIDSDIVNTGQAKSRTDKARTILGIIESKQKEVDLVSIEDVVREAVSYGMDEQTARKLIDDLYKQNEIIRPKHGFVATLSKRKQ